MIQLDRAQDYKAMKPVNFNTVPTFFWHIRSYNLHNAEADIPVLKRPCPDALDIIKLHQS
jgi:hypothetical protein